ncbi:MAG: prepilin-type N-terminal cleavage/methylation domain-containing protein [Candidatus Paceibacterota bacterium]|jgi:competence protein ComGC
MDKTSFFEKIKNRERGFTLMEMLGIVAIVSILAGFFFMANRSSSEEAKNMQIKALMNETAASIERYEMGGGTDPANSQQVLDSLGKIRDVYGSLLTNSGDVSVQPDSGFYWVVAPLIKNGALGKCFLLSTDGQEMTGGYYLNCES